MLPAHKPCAFSSVFVRVCVCAWAVSFATCVCRMRVKVFVHGYKTKFVLQHARTHCPLGGLTQSTRRASSAR